VKIEREFTHLFRKSSFTHSIITLGIIDQSFERAAEVMFIESLNNNTAYLHTAHNSNRIAQGLIN
jgi:dUTPase